MGFISLLFIKAGLLVFSNEPVTTMETKILPYFVVAFLAGYNVQNFLKKLEDISQATLGIDKKADPK